MNSIKELYSDFKNGIVYFMEEYPIKTGIVFLCMGILLMNYQLKKNNSFKMSEFNTLEWKGLVFTWGVILMSFSFGLILIFKN